jgi:hypothetical protein
LKTNKFALRNDFGENEVLSIKGGLDDEKKLYGHPGITCILGRGLFMAENRDHERRAACP